MSFNPSSTIYLCNVGFDNTYKNQVYFKTQTQQHEYFMQRVVKTYSDYLTVRKTLPSGQLQSSLKVKGNIDDLRLLNVNYMFYQNKVSSKFFYAFITNLIYINEDTTEIIFDTDVYQTWLFNVGISPSYVVREHPETDEIGEHLVPESFNFNDFTYEQAIVFDSLNEWGYLVVASNQLGNDSVRGQRYSNIYQGLYFYYFTSVTTMNNFLDDLEEEEGDCVLTITLIPQFCVSMNTVDDDTHGLSSSNKPASQSFSIETDITGRTFGDYVPVNNKLYSYPYLSLFVTNHQGDEAVYKIEDFYNNLNSGKNMEFHFSMFGDVSINPTVTLYPHYYKGIADNYDVGVSIGGFPQCAFHSDTYKLWLARNQFGVATDTIGNIASIGTGIASTVATGGVGAVLGASGIVSGISGILSTINEVHQASREPNRSKGGTAKTNLLTAINKNKFDIYYQKIKEDYARTIDDFFTMYGYQTNKVKIPNVDSRPYFNYVQTIDINLVGGIPSDDMAKLKQMYNQGVTLWKPDAVMYDYSVYNK